jgi:formamidopyrimidine-DNA glycosylase
MPELPEVEVLVRHLAPLLRGKRVRAVHIGRPKAVRPTSPRRFKQTLLGASFVGLTRRGKYLVFELQTRQRAERRLLLGHLGMTGRMYLLPARAPRPQHTAVALGLGRQQFIFEDTRYFGRLSLDERTLGRLGPEPLAGEFTAGRLAAALARSGQAIKIKLLDQSVVAGIGNIYASEALFRAGLAPSRPARGLGPGQVFRLWQAIRAVLGEAIACGSTVPLNFAGTGLRDGLFYFGRAPGAVDYYTERLQVYDRAGSPCPRCGAVIRRLVQAGRSTYYCPRCQA